MQRRPGSFPGNEAASGGLLSPKSAENLGLKLVNYILDDNSPSVKDLETRLKNVKLNYVSVQINLHFFFEENRVTINLRKEKKKNDSQN